MSIESRQWNKAAISFCWRLRVGIRFMRTFCSYIIPLGLEPRMLILCCFSDSRNWTIAHVWLLLYECMVPVLWVESQCLDSRHSQTRVKSKVADWAKCWWHTHHAWVCVCMCVWGEGGGDTVSATCEMLNLCSVKDKLLTDPWHVLVALWFCAFVLLSMYT